MQIDRVPDTVTARHIYQQAKAVENTTFMYLMAASNLDVMMKQNEVTKDEPPQKVGHNNPEEAVQFIKDITGSQTHSWRTYRTLTITKPKLHINDINLASIKGWLNLTVLILKVSTRKQFWTQSPTNCVNCM